MANKAGTTPTVNKFSGLLAARTAPAQLEDEQAASTSTDRAETPEAAPAKAPAPSKKEDRPKKLAKSKDDEWKGFTVMLKIETQADAVHFLRKSRSGEDFSELTEKLLAEWVEKQRSKTQK